MYSLTDARPGSIVLTSNVGDNRSLTADDIRLFVAEKLLENSIPHSLCHKHNSNIRLFESELASYCCMLGDSRNVECPECRRLIGRNASISLQFK